MIASAYSTINSLFQLTEIALIFPLFSPFKNLISDEALIIHHRHHAHHHNQKQMEYFFSWK